MKPAFDAAPTWPTAGGPMTDPRHCPNCGRLLELDVDPLFRDLGRARCPGCGRRWRWMPFENLKHGHRKETPPAILAAREAVKSGRCGA